MGIRKRYVLTLTEAEFSAVKFIAEETRIALPQNKRVGLKKALVKMNSAELCDVEIDGSRGAG